MKTKIIVIALIIVLMVGYGVCQYAYKQNYESYYKYYVLENAQSGELDVKINIELKCIKNYHLGDEISARYTCNGQSIRSGDVVDAQQYFKFVATITENDSVDDVGQSECIIYPYAALYNTTKTIDVRVDERGGTRYPDAYAIFQVTFNVSPVVEIGYWDVVFYMFRK